MSNLSATGSIKGFSEIDLGQAQTRESITPSNFSLTELANRIQEIRNNFDPNFLDSLIVTVFSHIQNENNPHQVTLTQTGANVMDIVYQSWLAAGNVGTMQQFTTIFFQVINTTGVATSSTDTNPADLVSVTGAESFIASHNSDPTAHNALLDIILPGTPPSTLPSMAYDAHFGVPVNATSTCTTPINVLDQNGNILSIPANTVGVDYSTGTPGFPLYGARTNLVFPSDPTLCSLSNLIGTNNSLPPIGTLSVGPDGNLVMILVEDTSLGYHGYRIHVTYTQGVEYTDSVFIYPLINTGCILLYVATLQSAIVMIDLSDYSITNENANVIGYAQPQPNGWVRIGIQYVASFSGTSNLNIMYSPIVSISASGIYQGESNNLFGIFGLQHVAGCGMSPYLPTTTATASHDATSISLPVTVGSAVTGMLGVFYDHPQSFGTQNRAIVSLEGASLVIYTSNGEISANVEVIGGIQPSLQAPDVYNQSAAAVVSFSPTACKFASTGSAKQTQSSGAINLATGLNTVILGSYTTPFDGIVTSIVLYPISDTNEELEFIVGEAS